MSDVTQDPAVKRSIVCHLKDTDISISGSPIFEISETFQDVFDLILLYAL